MKKILTILTALILTSSVAVLPVACVKTPENNKFFKIDNLKMKVNPAIVNLNQDNYNNILADFKNVLNDKLTTIITGTNKPLLGRDYQITIMGHDNYDIVKSLDPITVTVTASSVSKILVGAFNTNLQLRLKPKSISEITIPDQSYDEVIIDKTLFEDTIKKVLPIIAEQIKNIARTAIIDKDYVVNVEGHFLNKPVTAQDINKILFINIYATKNKPDCIIEGHFTVNLTLKVKDKYK